MNKAAYILRSWNFYLKTIKLLKNESANVIELLVASGGGN